MDALTALAAAQDVYHRYVASGTVEVPTALAALEVYNAWLDVLEPGHPQRQVIGGQAVLVMRGLSAATGDARWLDMAIETGRSVLSAPDNDALLSGLASVLSARSHLTGSLEDIDEAIELRRRALDGYGGNDPDRRASLVANLDIELSARAELMRQPTLEQRFLALQDRVTRYLIDGEASAVLDERVPAEARQLYEIAKRETGGTPIQIANTLAWLHLGRHQALGHPADGPDLPMALRIFESIAGHEPDLLPPDLLTGLDEGGRTGTFEAILAIRRNAVAATPHDHAERVERVNGLVSMLWTRILTTPGTAELDELIALRRGASVDDDSIVPHDLSQALRILYERSGNEADLDEAIDVARRAVAAVSPTAPMRSFLLADLVKALVIRFRSRRDECDLDDAIAFGEQLRAGGARRDQLATVGVALRLRAEITGRTEDLDEAVRIVREAVTADRSLPLDRSQQLSNLSNVLLRRYERVGASGDLDEAIAASSEAAELTLNDADRALYLCNLGAMLQTRFGRRSDWADLDRAVSSGARATALAPPDSPLHTTCLSTLCNTLHVRFRATGEGKDFDWALEIAQQLVAGTPPGHAERARRSSNVASLWTSRFQSTHDVVHLTHAIATARAATDITGSAPPERAMFLLILARALAMSGSTQDSHEALELAREAAQTDSAQTRLRAVAARLWASTAADQADWTTAGDGIREAVTLISSLTGHNLNSTDIEHRLGEFNGLGGEAAAIALNAVGPAEAVCLGEQARAFIWSRQLELRTDLTPVRLVAPELVDSLDSVRAQLGSIDSLHDLL